MIVNLGVVYFAVIFAANVATTVIFLVCPFHIICFILIFNIRRLLPYVLPTCSGLEDLTSLWGSI